MHPEYRVLLIEDNESHAFVMAEVLKAVGFRVWHERSLLAGLLQAEQLLAHTAPAIPTVLLIDVVLPHDHIPSLEGMNLIAHLSEGMEQGRLHPAHLVAISSEYTEQRQHELWLAGCHQILTKPLDPRKAAELRALVESPPAIPSVPVGFADERLVAITRQALRRHATQIVHLLLHPAALDRISQGHAPHDPIWDEEHTRQFLIDAYQVLEHHPWGEWIRTHGGLTAVDRQLRTHLSLEPELLCLFDQIRQQGATWQGITAALHIGRSTYYKRLDRLLKAMRVILNTTP